MLAAVQAMERRRRDERRSAKTRKMMAVGRSRKAMKPKIIMASGRPRRAGQVLAEELIELFHAVDDVVAPRRRCGAGQVARDQAGGRVRKAGRARAPSCARRCRWRLHRARSCSAARTGSTVRSARTRPAAFGFSPVKTRAIAAPVSARRSIVTGTAISPRTAAKPIRPRTPRVMPKRRRSKYIPTR